MIGNLNVGGSGKTPLVIWLLRVLVQSGFNPAVITRGYGGIQQKKPVWVNAQSDPAIVGDEPVLIAQKTGCTVLVSSDRKRAARLLETASNCDVILCDDGLQHYALARDIEICVVDGKRRFGNGHLLPAGPLREPVKRIDDVDYVVTNTTGGSIPHANEWSMCYQVQQLRSVVDDSPVTLPETTVSAFAGIGYPPRFFAQLKTLGLRLKDTKGYPDHHCYNQQELLNTFGTDPLIMTEKDAVKCRSFARENLVLFTDRSTAS